MVWGADGLVENLLANFFDVARIDVFIDRNAARRNGSCLGRPVRMPDTLGTAPRTILINSVDFADSIAADIARLTPGVTHRVIRMGDLLS